MNARRAGRSDGLLRFLPALTLVAVLTITASAEFELARTVLDLPPYIAWALPVAVDSYVLAALRAGRDVVPALLVMAGSLAASMFAHLAAANASGPLPGGVVAPAATGIMTVLVVVAWRVHVLIEYAASDLAASTSGAPADTDTPTARVAPPAAPVTSPASAPPARGAVGTPEIPSDLDQPSARSDADILAEIGANPPSIRALMRRYAIGQTRATRIHRTATLTMTTSTVQQLIFESEQQESSDRIGEDHEQESGKDDSGTHTCITDRVGPASPPGTDAASGADAPERVSDTEVAAR